MNVLEFIIFRLPFIKIQTSSILIHSLLFMDASVQLNIIVRLNHIFISNALEL
jgi:hypothetical protein